MRREVVEKMLIWQVATAEMSLVVNNGRRKAAVVDYDEAGVGPLKLWGNFIPPQAPNEEGRAGGSTILDPL